MPVNDPIGDMLTRMRNAQHARKLSCTVPWSRIKQGICELLKREGYLANVEVSGGDAGRDIIVSFDPEKILQLKRVSTPGRRIYKGRQDLKPVLSGYGVAIISTNNGLLTDREAREKKTGGEVLCTVS